MPLNGCGEKTVPVNCAHLGTGNNAVGTGQALPGACGNLAEKLMDLSRIWRFIPTREPLHGLRGS